MGSKTYNNYLMHRRHKYIAKIGEGVNAKYFYTLEQLNAYKKALSSKDEKEKYMNVDATLLDSTEAAKQGKTYQELSNERAAQRAEARADYERAKTLKGKAEDVAEVFNKNNPETVKRIKKGYDFVKKLFG